MKEIGSFIEMQFPNTGEYYTGDNVARLNTGRAAIYHAFRLTGCKNLWLPYYQCLSVQKFLRSQNVSLKFYHIGLDFRPLDLNQSKDDAVLLVNYYGVRSYKELEDLSARYDNVIIDNSHAFFCKPVVGTKTIYSCRKFFGVPDGAYVIADNAQMYLNEYKQGYSSKFAGFLLERIEYGCKGISYQNRMKNEKRLDEEPVLKMSELTKTILCSINYQDVKRKREENFKHLAESLSEKNMLSVYNKEIDAPMVYPFLCKVEDLHKRMIDNCHYQGPWWSHLLEMPTDSTEYILSKYLVPLTIDQRYKEEEMNKIIKLVL